MQPPEMSSPPAKRPRGGLLGGALQRKASSAALESVADSSASGAMVMTPTSEDGDFPMLPADPNRTCLGCARVHSHSRSFFPGEEGVVWRYATPRGSWCRDCHNVWRNTKRSVMSLTLYELHIQSPEHRLEHQHMLIAFVSLRLENHFRISKEMLEGRVKVLQHICQMMAIPFGPFVVTDLPETLDAVGSHVFPVMARSSEGMSIKLLQPAPMNLAGKMSLPTLHLNAGVERLFGTIVTDREEDIITIRSVFPQDLAAAAGASSSSAAASSSSVPQASDGVAVEDTSPIGIKVAGLMSATSAALQCAAETSTAQPGWQKAPVKILKNHYTRLQKLQTELLHCPNKHFHVTVEQMMKATDSIQALFKHLLVYHRKFSNLNDIFASSRSFVSWAREHNLPVHADIMSVIIKSEVREKILNDPAALQDLVFSSEVAVMVARQAQSSGSSKSAVMCSFVEDWLVSGIICKAESYGADGAAPEDDRRLAGFAELLNIIMGSMQRLSGLYPTDAKPFVDTVAALQVVAAAQPGTAVPSYVKRAQQTLNCPGAQQLQKGLLVTRLGQAMFANAASLVAAGALDDHCADMLAQASDILNNGALPLLVESEWVVDYEKTMNGQVAALVQDGLSAMLESTLQRSGVAMEAASNDYGSLLERLASVLAVLNIVEWGILQEAIAATVMPAGPRSADGDADLEDAEEDIFCEALGGPRFAGQAASDLIGRNFLRCPLMDLLARVQDAFDSLDKIRSIAPRLDTAVKLLGSLVPAMAAEARARSSLALEAAHIATMSKSTVSVANLKELLKEWETLGDKSSLGVVADIYRLQQKVRSADLLRDERVVRTARPGGPKVNSLKLHEWVMNILHGIPKGQALVQAYIVDQFVGIWELFLASDMTGETRAPAAETFMDFSDNGTVGPWAGLLRFVGQPLAERAIRLFEHAVSSEGQIAQAAAALSTSSLERVLQALTRASPPDLDLLAGAEELQDMADLATESVLHVVGVHNQVTTLISLMAWLAKRYDLDGHSCFITRVEDKVTFYTVDPRLEEAMTHLFKVFKDIDGSTNASLEKRRTPGATEPTFIDPAAGPLDPLRKIAVKAQTLWLPALQRCLGKEVVVRLQNISSTTGNLSPNWKFFIDDDKCNIDLAKKSLLGQSSRVTLGKQVTAHHEMICSITAAFEKWHMPPPEDYDVTKEEIRHSTEVLNYAKSTVAVVAAVSILTQPAHQRPAMAAAFLDTGLPAGFPVSLKREIAAAKQKK